MSTDPVQGRALSDPVAPLKGRMIARYLAPSVTWKDDSLSVLIAPAGVFPNGVSTGPPDIWRAYG